MKLTHLNIQNFCGVRAVDVPLNTPITLFGGKNHAGKSSLVEAIHAALTGDYSRVSLKKDLGQLVTDGAKKGSVVVNTAEADFGFELPSGKGQSSPSAYLPYLILNRFSGLETNLKRSLLFALTGSKVSKEVVFNKLAARKCNQEKYQTLDLSRGLEAAHKQADEHVRDARANWKAITGETYGSQKAEGWTATKPDVEIKDPEFFEAKIIALQKEITELNDFKTRLAVEQSDAAKKNQRITELTSKAGLVDRIKTKLAHDQSELSKYQKLLINAQSFAALEKSLPCPCCKALLALVDNKLVDVNDLEHEDNAPQLSIDEYQRSVNLFTSAIANSQRDLATAENAADELDDLGGIDLNTNADHADKINKAKVVIETRQKQINEVHAHIREQDALKNQLAQLDSATAKAAAHHVDVIEWTAIAEALSPNGIPAEILASALNPFNDQLRDVSVATGWAQVAIDADMQITANGRNYNLLSESEKWRVDAALAYAISQLSGLKLFVLDRFDVLDLPSRSACLKWLHGLASQSKIESVILCGTLKELPKLPPTYSAHWLENGELVTVQAAA